MTYRTWIKIVREELESLHMATDEWQAFWAYNFRRSYEAAIPPEEAANRAYRYWWREQYKLLRRQCDRAANCCLPRAHEGECQPIVGLNGCVSRVPASEHGDSDHRA